jgi:glutathione S-transferase
LKRKSVDPAGDKAVITVWGRRSSFNVQKVLWALGELELSFDRHNVGGSFGGTDSPAFKAINPNGLVPVIKDNNITMYESNAIVRYLAARYGDGRLRPREPEALALAEQWMEWSGPAVQVPATTLTIQLLRTPASQRKSEVVANATQNLARNLPIVDAALARSAYVAGSEFSMGDIPIGGLMWRLHALEWDRPATPNLDRWFKALQSRQAYKQWVMVPVGRSPEEWLANEKALA